MDTITELINEKISGKRIREVANNHHTSCFLAIFIGAELDIVQDYEYRRSKNEGRPCQPMREFEIASYCPYAVLDDQRVVWSTDDDVDLTNWSFSRGIPESNLDVVPRILGSYVKSFSAQSGTVRLHLDSGVQLVFYPFAVPPKEALVTEFSGPVDPDKYEDTFLDEFVFFNNVDRSTYTLFDDTWSIKPQSESTTYVDRHTGIPKQF